MGVIKRGNLIFAALMYIILIMTLPALKVSAVSDDYYISDINIAAAVDSNGNMSVKEEFEYVFNGSYTGIKRDVKTNGSRGIYDVNVRVSEDSKTSTPKFKINKIDGGKQIKIYSKSVNETKRFIISYKLKSVITKYSDLARLKWVFYSNTDDVKINRATVYLKLPRKVNKKVKLKGEGPSRGSALIENKEIKLELNDLQEDDVIGASVVFPTSWVNTTKKINIAMNDYDAMKRREKIRGIVAVTASILGITGLTSILIYETGRKRRRAIEDYRSQYAFYADKYYSQLPSDLSPELVAQLLNKSIDINELMASILNLENKGAITFLENGFFERDYDNLCFVINPDSPHHKLHKSEDYLVSWLRDYADRNVVYLSYIKANASEANFSSKLNEWKDKVTEEAERLNFYTTVMGKKILTNDYEDERIKWEAFKAYLLDSGDEEVIHLKQGGFWEKILPYAMVLGTTEGVIKHIEQHKSDSSFGNSIFMNYWFLNYYTGAYYSDIHKGYITYNHSSSNSSGNFSGGNGSGFGGGGGSSAF